MSSETGPRPRRLTLTSAHRQRCACASCLEAFLQGPIGPERPPAKGGMGVHIPTLRDATPGIQRGGSLRSQPQVPAWHHRPGDRGTTARPPITCGTSPVHVRNAFPRTSTPMSHVRSRHGPGRLQIDSNSRLHAQDRGAQARQVWPRSRPDPARPDVLVWRGRHPAARFSARRSCSPSREESNDGTHET